MKKIEEQMVEAICKRKNWQKDNTSVRFVGEVAEVYLFGNLIAKVRPKNISIWDGHHRTVTTKSRLNALLYHTNICVFQKDYQWYIRRGDVLPCNFGSLSGISLST